MRPSGYMRVITVAPKGHGVGGEPCNDSGGWLLTFQGIAFVVYSSFQCSIEIQSKK